MLLPPKQRLVGQYGLEATRDQFTILDFDPECDPGMLDRPINSGNFPFPLCETIRILFGNFRRFFALTNTLLTFVSVFSVVRRVPPGV